MKKILFLLPALILFLALAYGQQSAWAESEVGYYSAYDQPADYLLTPEELDDLVAPIALYPDPLIAQILPAATFIDQIDEAARYVRQFGRSARVDDMDWDVSVKAIAHYPDVLYMMDQKSDWTVALGQAFLDQPQDLMDSIQELRAEAMAQGNLGSTSQQQVIVESGDIRIVPAVPEYIYVPVYDPQVVYLERAPSYGFITFGAGLTIGAWLSRDLDWRGHRVYYHGWRGGGWVSRSRPLIHDRRGVYINRRATTINLNPRVRQHDTQRFRQELRREVETRRELPGRPVRPARPAGPARSNQPRPGRVDQPRASQPRIDQHRPPAAEPQRAPEPGRRPPEQQRAPVTGQRPPAVEQQRAPAPVQSPAVVPAPQRPQGGPEPGANLFRGRDVQKVQPASRSGYGGYGSGKDAEIYRERGQSSREKMRNPNPNRPATVQQPAPAPRQSAPPAPAPAPRPVIAPAPAPRPLAAPAPAPRPAVAPEPRPHVPRPVMPEPRPGVQPPANREQPRP